MDVKYFMIILAVLWSLFYFFKDRKSIKQAINQVGLSQKTINAQHKILINRFPYYAQLDASERKTFLIRVNQFMKSKKFIGRREFRITPEIRLLISSAAVQLTFGLDNYLLPRFSKILIYPDSFLNKRTRQYHEGEVNPNGIIVLSWRKFTKGYNDLTDKMNLGLHEMAHALLLTIMMGNDHDDNLDEFLDNIVKISKQERRRIHEDPDHFLRDYAKSNIHEFFAVAIEHFFEAPSEFRSELPQLYKYICLIINQDPVNRLNQGIKYDDYFKRDIDGNYLRKEGMVFKSRVFANILIHLPFTLFVLFVLVMIFYNTSPNWNDFLYNPSMYFGIILAIYLFLFRKITVVSLYKSYFKIRTPFRIFSPRILIPLANIISCKFSSRFEIVYANSGKVNKRIFHQFDFDSKEHVLHKHLQSKQIITTRK